MIVATVREIKTHEYRVGLTPDCAHAYHSHGHRVLVEAGAGRGAGFLDEQYRQAGAEIVSSREEVFEHADMIIKVKEPLEEEIPLLREGHILYTYLHLAASKPLTEGLLSRGIRGVAYETIEGPDGSLPCLKPMSEIAGRLAVQAGARFLEKPAGGRGVLLGAVPGIPRAKVAILGAGVAGSNACRIAVGMGADVTVLDLSAAKLAYLDDLYFNRVTTLYSNESNIEKVVRESDLVIGCVLVHGASAPKLILRKHLKMMKPGSVIVDVAVDQGGCIETSRPTTHEDPVFTEEGIVHYCVANMPGAVSLSSTQALTSTTLRLGLMIADEGLEEACRHSRELAKGVNVYRGRCTYENVAVSLGLAYTPLEQAMS